MPSSVLDRETSTLPAAAHATQTPSAPAVEPPPFAAATVVADYRLAYQSRQMSLLGRREVLTGKAKFGIFGDGKEIAQLALAHAFAPGDFRSGYYRDQTLMLALGLTTIDELFAQLYANPDETLEPCSAGRSMNAHFATPLIDRNGRYCDQTARINSSADVSPTASQMPRLVGLAYASKLYRHLPELADLTDFSRGGAEVAFGTIGNASCAEGMFWEAVNAIGVLGAPMVLAIYDDGYGISVPNEYQITKEDLSALLSGFRRAPGGPGYELATVKGWDYPALVRTFRELTALARREHVPAIVHVVEMTQPQGHSTSGSHERYKSKERLAWEAEYDPLRKMRQWMVAAGVATDAELDAYEAEDKKMVRERQQAAWDAFRAPIDEERRTVLALTGELAAASARGDEVRRIEAELARHASPLRRDLVAAAHAALLATVGEGPLPAAARLAAWRRETERENQERYGSHLHLGGSEAALHVPAEPPVYAADAPSINGFEVLNACFRAALKRVPQLVAMGEDVGKIGDVNQGFADLQREFGNLRVSDTGIRETTILGQAIGLAMRGLRPIAEIQYLDYVLYALQILSDDLATLTYRTKGKQKAPVIVRTRGHRLEGIWHSGSPMAGVLNLVRGMYVCVPRNMTQAAGFYNTLLQGDDPAIVVEVLNAYRLKEKLPANIATVKVPLGQPEVLRPGDDVTVVTYGACCRIVLEAAERLARVGIEIEVIDVQTLLPFDLDHRIVRSLQKTNRILFVDEDVPGGASAYLMQQVVEGQDGYKWLDSPPRTLAAAAHRPAYGSDGDYWSKPNRESIFTAVYEMMRETDPRRFPVFY
ncbi:MAG TPA: thiamine pyrophosphate-dependent enzyme [Thermoanaerobaculia bacterium]